MRMLGMKEKGILWADDKTKNVNDNLQKRNILIEKKKEENIRFVALHCGVLWRPSRQAASRRPARHGE